MQTIYTIYVEAEDETEAEEKAANISQGEWDESTEIDQEN